MYVYCVRGLNIGILGLSLPNIIAKKKQRLCKNSHFNPLYDQSSL